MLSMSLHLIPVFEELRVKGMPEGLSPEEKRVWLLRDQLKHSGPSSL